MTPTLEKEIVKLPSDQDASGRTFGAEEIAAVTAVLRSSTQMGRHVREMQERRMIVDLAHASPQMVRDVLALPETRPIVSHTGVRGHCDTPRNLADDLLQAVATKGGIVGIGFWGDVNCSDTPAGIAASIRAAIALIGEDHVALGSDWDGSVGVPFDAADLPALTQALMDAGLTEAQIAKVMGGNMMRYLSETLPPG